MTGGVTHRSPFDEGVCASLAFKKRAPCSRDKKQARAGVPAAACIFVKAGAARISTPWRRTQRPFLTASLAARRRTRLKLVVEGEQKRPSAFSTAHHVATVHIQQNCAGLIRITDITAGGRRQRQVFSLPLESSFFFSTAPDHRRERADHERNQDSENGPA